MKLSMLFEMFDEHPAPEPDEMDDIDRLDYYTEQRSLYRRMYNTLLQRLLVSPDYINNVIFKVSDYKFLAQMYHDRYVGHTTAGYYLITDHLMALRDHKKAVRKLDQLLELTKQYNHYDILINKLEQKFEDEGKYK